MAYHLTDIYFLQFYDQLTDIYFLQFYDQLANLKKRGLLRNFEYIIKQMDFFCTEFLFHA